MRILSIGNFTGPSWDGSLPDEEHIAGALEALGHDVARVQRETAYDDIVKHWGNPLFDFVLIAQWDNYDERLWSMLPHPRVYWAFDYQADGQEWHERLVAEADLYLSKRIADSKYPNWQYLSQNFAPEFLHRPNYNPPAYQDIDVLFTGSYLDWAHERNETLKAVDEKFSLVVHSANAWPGFKDVRPPIMDEGLPELYNRAKVILSIDHTLEAGYHSDRNAQIMCSGFKPLFRYVPFSELSFHDHIEYFYSVEDCLRKIESMQVYGNSHLNNNSYAYAQENLTVKSRVQDLLTIVKSIL